MLNVYFALFFSNFQELLYYNGNFMKLLVYTSAAFLKAHVA
ncbi:hypothetical protein D922_02947 [Enterococcus faecalis 06-MB-DW-09]|nr:hypothetical protein D931_01260 [Enterococcus faecium 13.SD.W.09]EPH90602.1 hypothetical protein D922_02947 [Enterococcus faecalis 06-MB-DW-09]